MLILFTYKILNARRLLGISTIYLLHFALGLGRTANVNTQSSHRPPHFTTGSLRIHVSSQKRLPLGVNAKTYNYYLFLFLHYVICSLKQVYLTSRSTTINSLDLTSQQVTCTWSVLSTAAVITSGTGIAIVW